MLPSYTVQLCEILTSLPWTIVALLILYVFTLANKYLYFFYEDHEDLKDCDEDHEDHKGRDEDHYHKDCHEDQGLRWRS